MAAPDSAVTGLWAQALRFPLPEPESDGTLSWDSTTMVLVEVEGGEAERGVGYSYTDASATSLIGEVLAGEILGRDALDIPAMWEAMVRRIRNLGRPGIASSAIAAVDNALWDLKARILGLPLCRVLGMTAGSVPVYASGGFTSYDQTRLRRQIAEWAEQGFSKVKIKVGRDSGTDPSRVAAVRKEIGDEAEVFVDANGAYHRKQALAQASAFSEQGVNWFEEPVSSDDLAGLRLVRDRAPAGLDITAGEYGYDIFYFRRMLDAGAVDVLQIDVTRCAGITEMLRVAALARSHSIPVSTHTAASQHLHPACALSNLAHMEYFHDHARIESEVFDGVVPPGSGVIRPDLTRPGVGLEIKRPVAESHRLTWSHRGKEQG